MKRKLMSHLCFSIIGSFIRKNANDIRCVSVYTVVCVHCNMFSTKLLFILQRISKWPMLRSNKKLNRTQLWRELPSRKIKITTIKNQQDQRVCIENAVKKKRTFFLWFCARHWQTPAYVSEIPHFFLLHNTTNFADFILYSIQFTHWQNA